LRGFTLGSLHGAGAPDILRPQNDSASLPSVRAWSFKPASEPRPTGLAWVDPRACRSDCQVFPREPGSSFWSRRGRIVPASCALVYVLGWTASALADPIGPTASLGTGWHSTPGYSRVPVVAAAEPGLTLTGGLGYGFTESQSAAPGGHHRLQGRLGASLAPLPWLDLSLGSNLRHDRHGDDGQGTDQGTVLDSDVRAQAGAQLASDLHLGASLGAAFMRGATLGRSLENPAIDLLLLGAYLPRHAPYSVGILAGYRYDRTAAVARDPARYRSGDRLSLEVSEFDALPLGVGAAVRLGSTECIGELSGDILVGPGAPPFLQSPLRLSAGARQRVGQNVSLRVMADTSLSSRPAVGVNDPLLPVEPRFQFLVGMSYHWLSGPSLTPTAPTVEPPALAPAAPVALASLEVQVSTLEGYPLSDATVELLEDEQVIEVPHGQLESYRVAQLAPRSAILRVSAARLQTQTQPIQLRPGAPLVVEVKLSPAPPTGQVRGLVRSFSGVGLRARVRVEPLGKEIQTDAAGAFQIDVPPGSYEVVVAAPGHGAQRRRVQVPEDGVVILNADLLRGQP
jgi:Carboxypeptidase regulatory-like domain